MEYDYNLKDLATDELYNLLPYVVRAQDPDVIKHYFAALADQHNFLVSKLREMPRAQDPTQAGAFVPESLGESSAVFAEWLQVRRTVPQTPELVARAETLSGLVPYSINAHEREQQILRLLAKIVGESIESGLPEASIRPLLATAIQRHQIRGGHVSFSLLGRIAGFFELKVRELWTRFSITNPSDADDPENESDFSPVPDQRPFWPRNDRHLGVGDPGFEADRQLPEGDPAYNPFILDDDGTVEVEFRQLLLDPRSTRYYNTVLNGRNPFVHVLGEVEARLKPGFYTMGGGTESAPARATVPYRTGTGSVTFEAITTGDYGNKVTITVGNETSGHQRIGLEGPRSKIKFKSSVFDLILGVDPNTFFSTLPAIPVTMVWDATVHDGSLGRNPPAFPITGNSTGGVAVSHPDTHYQLNLDGYQELMTVMRNLIEEVRPITRTIRRRALGLVLSSFVRYAPSLAVNHVVLTDSSGQNWSLNLSYNTVSWTKTSVEATLAPVQYDRVQERWMVWAISTDGVLIPYPSFLEDRNQADTVVYYPGSGFVWLEGGGLLSGAYTLLSDSLHGDGTGDEAVVGEAYTHVSDNPPGVLVRAVPPVQARDFMSAEAFYGTAPPESLIFQPVPEDDLRVFPTFYDTTRSHVAAHFGTEDGGIEGNWSYTNDGQVMANDLRLRHAGTGTGLVDPVPTGAGGRGMTYDEPVGFMNYHGVYATRYRDDGAPISCFYRYDSVDAASGPTLVVGPGISGDGPMEGGVAPEPWSVPEAMGPASWDPDTVTDWHRYNLFDLYPAGPYTGVANASSVLRVIGIQTQLPPGSGVRLASSDPENDGPHAGLIHIVEGFGYGYGGYLNTTSAWLGGPSLPGVAWYRSQPLRSEGVATVKLVLTTPENGEGTVQVRLFAKTGDGDDVLLNAATPIAMGRGDSYSIEITLPDIDGDTAELFWLESTGTMTAVAEVSFLGQPVLTRAGQLMASHTDRDDLQVFILREGERWWTYDANGPSPQGDSFWRGGSVSGTRNGFYLDRGELPALLLFETGTINLTIDREDLFLGVEDDGLTIDMLNS